MRVQYLSIITGACRARVASMLSQSIFVEDTVGCTAVPLPISAMLSQPLSRSSLSSLSSLSLFLLLAGASGWRGPSDGISLRLTTRFSARPRQLTGWVAKKCLAGTQPVPFAIEGRRAASLGSKSL